MTSILNNPKYLNRLWAALNSDFECLENLYLISQGWKFEDFAKCCRQLEITLVMHATLGRGKGLDDHYNKTTNLIIQTAKSFWLRPYTKSSTYDNSLDTKRRVGGFFLTYLMYSKQPHKGRIKIALGIKDLEIALAWRSEVSMSVLRDEIEFIIEDLARREAFQFQLTVPSYGFQAEIRNYLNNSRSEIIPLTKEMKNIQDDMTFSGLTLRAQSLYVKYETLKKDIVKKIVDSHRYEEMGMANPKVFITEEEREAAEKGSESENSESVFDKRSFKVLSRCVGGENWKNAINKLADQADKPVLTIQNLTATEAIDRRMMMETRKRIERMRKKVLLSHKEGVPKTSRPYVNEGGIFGRKKEVLEGEQKEKRERGLCSGNLWTFINGYDFGKMPEDAPVVLLPIPDLVLPSDTI